MPSTARLTVPLIITMILGAVAMAPSASAQVEVTNEENGAHCPPVWLGGTIAFGGCFMSVDSSGPVRIEAFGALVSECYTSLDWRVDEDGHGYMYDQDLSGGGCTTPPCEDDFGIEPWETEFSEWLGSVIAELRYCFESSALGTVRCHLAYVHVHDASHQPHIDTLSDACEGNMGFVHVTGALFTFGAGLEIAH